jgi:hypothetical protein
MDMQWWSCLMNCCQHGRNHYKDLILAPRCIAQRHLSPDLLTRQVVSSIELYNAVLMV